MILVKPQLLRLIREKINATEPDKHGDSLNRIGV